MTPNVPNGGRHVPPELVASKGTTESGDKRTVGLESQTKHWATPTAGPRDASCSSEAAHAAMMRGNYNQDSLSFQVYRWATPNAHDGRRPGADLNSTQGANLSRDAAQWPTPSSSIANDGESPETWHARAAKLKEKHGNGNGAGLPLTIASVQWPTPAARDSKGPNSEQHALETGGGRKHMDQLANFVAHTPLDCLRPDPQTHDGPQSLPPNPGAHPPSTKRLNPYFTEWLMGWPAGWTSATERPASSAAEMASYRFRLRQQLSCLFAECRTNPAQQSNSPMS